MTLLQSANPESIEIQLLLEAIYSRYGYDFRKYSFSSIRRRILSHLPYTQAKTISELQHQVLHHPNAMSELLLHISVQVTQMFRDPLFFRLLREEILPGMADRHHLKIWSAGCSTGEEAYSLAIILRELGLEDRSRIYATDINQEGLNKAEKGILPLENMKEYSANYFESGGIASLSDYLTTGFHASIMDPSLNKRILFSDHNLVTDHSFGEMDLIICRNVLIYFSQELQDRVLDVFIDSMAPGGTLCLGPRETIRFSNHAKSLKTHSDRWRVYQWTGS